VLESTVGGVETSSLVLEKTGGATVENSCLLTLYGPQFGSLQAQLSVFFWCMSFSFPRAPTMPRTSVKRFLAQLYVGYFQRRNSALLSSTINAWVCGTLLDYPEAPIYQVRPKVRLTVNVLVSV